MIPKYDFSESGRNSAYKKIALWVESGNDPTDLYCAVPPEFQRGSAWSSINNSYKTPDLEDIKTKANLLYEVVCKALGYNLIRLSSLTFSKNECSQIIVELRKHGFNVVDSDIIDITRIAMAIRDRKFDCEHFMAAPDREWRHASLNCYDMDRLLLEANLLGSKIGFEQLAHEAHVLHKIISECELNSDYPGRHLQYHRIGRIKGKSPWRYQCLRMMDEILCTSDRRLKNDEMRVKIRNKCDRLGIPFKDIPEDTFKKLYKILSELINVEHFNSNKQRYIRNVYESGRLGHRYAFHKEKRRLCAFAVDIAFDEASKLRREIGRLRLDYFNDDQAYFSSRFPMISMLGRLDELSFEDGDENLNSVYQTDLVTVNYQPDQLSDLKKKVAKLVSVQMPIAIKQDDNREIVMPIELKAERDRWVLIARTVDTSALRVFTPEQLLNSLRADIQGLKGSSGITDTKVAKEKPSPIPLIGIGPLINSRPFEVTLRLTLDGIVDLERKNSILRPLKPQIITYGARLYAKEGEARFKAYLNEDLLAEILRLDRAGNLVLINPIDVRDIFEKYFVKQMGYERTPLDERPKTMKRLARPKKNQSE